MKLAKVFKVAQEAYVQGHIKGAKGKPSKAEDERKARDSMDKDHDLLYELVGKLNTH